MAVVKLILLITMATASPQFASALNERAIEPAPSHLFLFAASISNPTFGHTCTGIILNKRWIISSALCIAEHSQDENELKIYYGSHNRTHNQRKTADIEKIVFHPAFEQRKLRNNLALMRIKADIDFIPTVVEAAVLPTKDAFPNDTAAVIGWEQIDAERQSDTPEMLKYQRTEIISSDLCLRLIFHQMNETIDQSLCTRVTAEDTFPALDNGNALISDGNKELIGVATWRTNDFPNVFVRIRTHLAWIKTVIF